jgi:hypothetical protein
MYQMLECESQGQSNQSKFNEASSTVDVEELYNAIKRNRHRL